MPIRVGDLVSYAQQSGCVISVQTVFGDTYLDVFIEPTGPIRRVLVKDVGFAKSGSIRREWILRQFNDYLWETTAGQKLADVRSVSGQTLPGHYHSGRQTQPIAGRQQHRYF